LVVAVELVVEEPVVEVVEVIEPLVLDLLLYKPLH
tara:strand:+ start:613 stop:717 length:105 start_codon:yes stop_codon:yes gene_type:complete